MSKVICEVCGTSYPETATQCPICGCVRAADATAVSGDTAVENAGYTYVKGGRFSKANVKKRNRGEKVETVEKVEKQEKPEKPVPQELQDEESTKNNKGLVITAAVLLIAIIAVVAYIVIRFFFPVLGNYDPNSNAASSQATVLEIPCTDVKLNTNTIILNNIGDARMIYAELSPAETTDEVVFTSSDERVATVSKEGKVVAIGHGRAIITATCGDALAECVVECTFQDPTEATEPDPTTETSVPTTPVEAQGELKLNRKDITFSYKGEAWVIYDGSISKTNITWSTDNASVATIDNGKVTAVGKGETKVHAEYNGEKVSCIIRCSFASNSDPVINGSGGGISEDGGGISEDGAGTGGNSTSGGTYSLYNATNPSGSNSDVTISVNESFTLTLRNSAGSSVSATWSVDDSAICSVSGGSIKGIKGGTATVTATYEGESYNCIVRVY